MRQALDIPKLRLFDGHWLERVRALLTGSPTARGRVDQLPAHLLRDIGLCENARGNPLLNDRIFLR
jgi:hypothetical protein